MAVYPKWKVAILKGIGAPVTQNNLKLLDAWQRAEGGSAAFNPLNTTQPASGAGSYNSVGVRNYRSAEQGTKATIDTLLNGRYGSIIDDLRHSATPMKVAADVASSPWGTGHGVERVLGGTPMQGSSSAPQRTPSGVVSPSANSVGPVSAGGSVEAQGGNGGLLDARKMLASFLLDVANNNGQIDPQSLLSFSMFRGSLPASQAKPLALQMPQGATLPAGTNTTRAPTSAVGGVNLTGMTKGLNPAFAKALSIAAKAAGATKVKIISGYRSPEHNVAVGGAAHSNHISGHAADGFAYVPGKGWVPLGTVLRPFADRFGLRSGDTPGFFHGQPDPNHVDDAYNQRI